MSTVRLRDVPAQSQSKTTMLRFTLGLRTGQPIADAQTALRIAWYVKPDNKIGRAVLLDIVDQIG